MRNSQLCTRRFNSAEAPLSRLILFFDAIWATAIEVATVPRGAGKSTDGPSPELDALFFLEQTDEERIVQLAMMADVAEETLHVTRFFDNPGDHHRSYDLARMPKELHHFLRTIDYIFVSQERGCLTCGFNHYALRLSWTTVQEGPPKPVREPWREVRKH